MVKHTDKIGKTATTVFTTNGTTRVVYHCTVVVEFDQDRIILKNGGWLTQTTKTRMNQASAQFDLGFSVAQQNHKWFVTFKGDIIPFVEGMTLKR